MTRQLPRVARSLVAVVLLAAAQATPMWARITSNADGEPTTLANAELSLGDGLTGFAAQVQACFDKYKRYPEKAKIVEELQRHDWVFHINKDDEPFSHVDTWGGEAGIGGFVRWNPTSTVTYPDGTVRDPCAALFHELAHAQDSLDGSMDGRPVDTTPGDGNDANTIPRKELGAVQLENWFRKREGLPQRTSYGVHAGQDGAIVPTALPGGLIFDRCPDGVCLFIEQTEPQPPTPPGTPPQPDPVGTPSVVDHRDLYFEVPLVSDGGIVPLPGSEIPISDEDGAVVAVVKLQKLLSGKIVVILTCNELGEGTLTLESIKWKVGDRVLEPAVEVFLVCEQGSGGSDHSGQLDPPDLGSTGNGG